MPVTSAELELDWARDVLWSGATEAPDYRDALTTLCQAVDGGALEYAGLVAEALALDGPHHDAGSAYVYYYVAYSQDGYLVAWANENYEPNQYLGPDGDYRNGAMVSGLVRELGVAALRALDERAAAILQRGP
jgi:hypothetical protein